MTTTFPLEDLHGQFVVEVGVRQAWPFITFCDNEPTPAIETRLYVDTTFRLDPSDKVFDDGDPHRAITGLLELTDKTVIEAKTTAAGDLTLRFNDDAIITLKGTAASFTTHDVWWFATP